MRLIFSKWNGEWFTLIRVYFLAKNITYCIQLSLREPHHSSNSSYQRHCSNCNRTHHIQSHCWNYHQSEQRPQTKPLIYKIINYCITKVRGSSPAIPPKRLSCKREPHQSSNTSNQRHGTKRKRTHRNQSHCWNDHQSEQRPLYSC